MPVPFDELPSAQRRQLLRHAGARMLRTTILVFGLYFVLPFDESRGATPWMLFLGGGVLFVAILGWQVSSIMRADYPQLQAIETVGLAIPLLVVVFSAVYLSLSTSDPGAFSEDLDHIDAMYFTITVLGTVGFGDIAPKGHGPRVLVSAQMLFDLVLLGVVFRLIVEAARRNVDRQREGLPPVTPSDS
jgi:hypothetical protein